ncbi:MAG TPA: hypothetical protein ENN40_05190 [Candidatus Aminicenantes bacterium]|nr:hypothetical protein [Candidatus Aminicenantes bacterium]
MKRREFIMSTGAMLAAAPFMNFGAGTKPGRRMLVLAFDGMDPAIANRLMQKGELPNLQRLAGRGGFTMMRTTIPAQSPVAWASFAVGSDPGATGVYDFLARDPKTYMPEFSQAQTIPASSVIKLGKYRIPLKSSRVELGRQGKPFWNTLEENGVPATLFKLPGNYPPSPTKQRTISGMGTPDIKGTYGIYTLYTTDESEAERDISPNLLYYAYINEQNMLEDGWIEGPENDLKVGSGPVRVPFKAYLDYRHKTARIDVQGKTLLVSEGEYSDWVEVDFPLIEGISSVTGMVKFYLMELGKRFRLYISPVHVSPLHPATDICTPDNYSRELAREAGLFHMINLPADTKALQQNTFSLENFIVQSQSVFKESRRLFHYELERFEAQSKGLLFFYFSSLDQGQHMYWALTDPQHPFYQPETASRYGHVLEDLYRQHDRVLGEALEKLPPDVAIMVMSDHGFGTFRREVNINNWLHDEGYLKLSTPDWFPGQSFLEYGNWGETQAYTLGLNGLYLNMKGREAEGIVKPVQRRHLLNELKSKLEALRDPINGERIISNAYITEDVFSPTYLDRAPDIILGFRRGYRTVDNGAMGGFSEKVVDNRMDWWSGDHCIDPLAVPASFLSSFPINRKVPDIRDMAPTILEYFGVKPPPTMTGKPLV